jgi:bifunctional ADP-heptose synthase (sugar kinase/adenylyltransferase)
MMKVTAIIPDKLVKEAQILSNAKNITDAMIIALNAYVSLEKMKSMGELINKSPMQFKYTAQEVRDLNRL